MKKDRPDRAEDKSKLEIFPQTQAPVQLIFRELQFLHFAKKKIGPAKYSAGRIRNSSALSPGQREILIIGK